MQLRRIKLGCKALTFVAEYLALEPVELMREGGDGVRLRVHQRSQLRGA